MTTTWHFEVCGDDSGLFGEQFFVEVEGNLDTAKARAIAIAQENFPGELLECWDVSLSWKLKWLDMIPTKARKRLLSLDVIHPNSPLA